MQAEDLILVSVDDHVVEPPDLFDGHLPDKWRDLAPRIVPKDNGTDVWLYDGNEIPNIGLNAVVGRPPEEYGIEPDLLRRDAARLLRHPRAGPGHERQRRARLDVLPVVPAVLRAAVRPIERQGRRPGHAPGLQRLAHRRLVRRRTRAGSSPSRSPAIWDPELMAAEVRRVAAEGLPRRHLLGEPREAGLAELPLRPLGPVLAGLRGRGHGGVPAHRLVVAAGHHRRWTPRSTS